MPETGKRPQSSGRQSGHACAAPEPLALATDCDVDASHEPLTEHLRMVFVEAFADAALLRDPDRTAIKANVELEVRMGLTARA